MAKLALVLSIVAVGLGAAALALNLTERDVKERVFSRTTPAPTTTWTTRRYEPAVRRARC
jgi:hypothetical protein